jgi:purine-nucleoside phosphorylase
MAHGSRSVWHLASALWHLHSNNIPVFSKTNTLAMSLHIGAAPGDIAETVLISGDPLRARFVAEKMLTDVKCYSRIRNMLGYTGRYKGKRVSVQGTGIGIPSTAIYVHELIASYGVKKIIRIGTCGAIQPDLQLDQLILATAAYTDSITHLQFYRDMNEPSRGDGGLLHQATSTASSLQVPVLSGEIFSTDIFYDPNPHRWDPWISRGLLAIEMESSIIYSLAAKSGIQALSILSVSDNILTHIEQTAVDREEASVPQMMLALEIA